METQKEYGMRTGFTLIPPFHHMAPCHEQPGKQQWHAICAIWHPIRFARSRGPRRFRYSGTSPR